MIRTLAFACILIPPSMLNAGVTISFDYSYDSGNYYSTSRRACLDEAADFFEGIITDDLDAITPNGNNSWSANPFNPGNPFGANLSIPNPSIPADTILIYAGAANLGGALGVAGPGGYNAPGGGTSLWYATLRERGEGQPTQTSGGTTATEFAPWGGSLSMNSTTDFDFGDVTSCAASDGSGNSHFYSVLLHEIAHVLGWGTADSWTAHVSGTDFTGPNSVAEYGGNVPLYTDPNTGSVAHWAENTSSMIYGTSTVQEAAMDPNITVGTRKFFTELDAAALRDVGWDVTAVPEPSPMVWGSIAIALVGITNYRRKLYSVA